MNIEKYAVCPSPDDCAFDNLYDNYEEAKAAAISTDGVVIVLTFNFNDSELVDDFRKRCYTCDELLTSDNCSLEENECHRCSGVQA